MELNIRSAIGAKCDALSSIPIDALELSTEIKALQTNQKEPTLLVRACFIFSYNAGTLALTIEDNNSKGILNWREEVHERVPMLLKKFSN